MFPGDTSKWKVEAFLEVKKKYDESVKKITFYLNFINTSLFIITRNAYFINFFKIIANIICLGDSHIELDAGHALAK